MSNTNEGSMQDLERREDAQYLRRGMLRFLLTEAATLAAIPALDGEDAPTPNDVVEYIMTYDIVRDLLRLESE